MPILHSCDCNYLVEPYRVHLRGPISLCPPANSDCLSFLVPDLTMISLCIITIMLYVMMKRPSLSVVVLS